MSRSLIGIILLILGLLIVVVALSAGYIGLSHTTSIGTNKMLMAGAGLVVGIVGLVLAVRK